VATVAINGAKNAGLLAAQILGATDLKLRQRIQQFKAALEAEVLAKAERLEAGEITAETVIAARGRR